MRRDGGSSGRLPRHGGRGCCGGHHLQHNHEAIESRLRAKPPGLAGARERAWGRWFVVVGGMEVLAEDEGGGAGEEEVIRVEGER